VKAINHARKVHQIWNHPQEERYVLDNIYCFNRGDFFVALTNQGNNVNIQPQTPQWSNGTKVCNIFYPTTDCQTVQNGKIDLWLTNGESKVYVPAGSQALLPESEWVDYVHEPIEDDTFEPIAFIQK